MIGSFPFRLGVAAALGVSCCVGSRVMAEPTDVTWAIERGWLAARADGTALLTAAAGRTADVTIDDKPLLASRGRDPQVRRSSSGGFEVTYSTAKGTLVDRYEPLATLGPDAWLRTLVYTNRSQASQDLVGARMRLAPVRMKGGAVWNPKDFWMGQVAADRAVCVSYRGSTEHYHLQADERDRICHHVRACWRLAPGQQATIGAQGIWIGKPGREPFRDEAQRWFAAIGLRVPEDTPDWLDGAILYELSAGGHVDSRFSDVGGFDHLARQVDYLADLGITAVWLQAVHQHKTPPGPVKGGWNLYDPRDFAKVDPILGGPEALKRLTDALRARGIREVGEIVPHGGHSVQAMALKPWWTCGRDGAPRRNWGGAAMDYASPEWQAVMRKAVAMLSRDYGMVGARVDVADGSGANWRSPRTNHASYSTLGGALEMLRSIRDGLAEGTRSPVLIPESDNTVEFFALTAVGYGHSSWFLFGREIPLMIDRPALMVSRLREFFERERGSHPTGARILRTLNNHDTVVESGRVHYRYGAGLARALYGVCLMVPGIPMMYQEEEVGSLEARRRLNWARRRVPELGDGRADYHAVDVAPEVFTCLRSRGSNRALGLSNLSGKTIVGSVRVPSGLSIGDGTRVVDAVSGREAVVQGDAFRWTLGPYETALLRIGRPPVGDVPPLRFMGETPAAACEKSALAVEPFERGLRIRGGCLRGQLQAGPGPWRFSAARGTTDCYASSYGTLKLTRRDGDVDVELHLGESGEAHTPEMVILNADRWAVSGRTALLDDRLLRRHFPFPPEANYTWLRTKAWGSVQGGGFYRHAAPTGRLWQSLLEPLHPDRPAVAFTDVGGAALLMSGIETSARNVVLTDRTDEQHDGPYGLALRFHAADPDLSPRAAVVGWQPWTMKVYPKPAIGEQSLRFTIRLTDAEGARAALDAPRLPVRRSRASVRREGDRFNEDRHGLWFIEPGTVTWTGLVPPVKGRYRIRLELRHSETSASGTDLEGAYVVRVDGEAVPLTWVRRDTYHVGNAYFGHAITPPLDLTTRGRSISVSTRKTWCAMRGTFHLVPVKGG